MQLPNRPQSEDAAIAGLLANDEYLMRQMAGGYAGAPFLTANSPPPIDGQESAFLADATNGVVWHLKYRAASASAYKWEFVGGGYLRSAISYEAAKVATAANTAADFTTPITLTLPLSGDYDVEASGSRNLSNTSGAGTNVNIIASSGALVGYHTDAGYGNLAAQFNSEALSVAARLTGTTAPTTVSLKWLHSNTLAAVNYAGIAMRIRPVRVG